MITARMKSLFFDRAAVMERIGKATAKALTKIGGTVRKTAQRSMRYRKKPSPVGTPPSAHKDNPRGPLLRELLWFAYEPERSSVVIGPVGFGGHQGTNTVPHVQEFGGTITRLVRANTTPKHGRRASPAQAASFRRKLASGQIQVKKVPKVRKTVTLPKRPFMGPALKKTTASSTLNSAWKNSFSKAG